MGNGTPVKVVSFLTKKQGRQASQVKAKVRNLLTGALTEENFPSGSKYEVASTELTDATYSYYNADEGKYVFMDSETFEELEMSSEDIGKGADFLNGGDEVTLE